MISVQKLCIKGPALSTRHSPIGVECRKSPNEEGGTVILTVSESGIAYTWNLKTVSQGRREESNKVDAGQHTSVNVRRV